MYQPNASQVVTFGQDGSSDPRYLGQLGHIGALTYSYVLPGGCDNMTCNLMQPPLKRYTALKPGRIVRIYRGASAVWEGKLNEPVPSSTGWAIQAYGNGHYGDDFMSYYTNYATPGDPVIKAIAGVPAGRGQLRWVAPASWPSGLYLQQPPDSASVSITQYLNDITGPANLVWYVGRGNQLSVFTPPTAVSRLLVVTEPQARTLAGYFDWLWLRYQSQAQVTNAAGSSNAAQYSLTSVDNPPQMTEHGTKEIYGDLSNAGTLSNAGAEAVGTKLIAKYVAANFAGPFPAVPGQLLTVGGAPVDLGTEQAGTVVRVVMASDGYGGDVTPGPPIQFLTGAITWNDEAETAAITPWLSVSSDLATLLTNYATVHSPRTPLPSAIKYQP